MAPSSGNDSITGTSGDDTLRDTDGNLYYATGSDTISGGGGDDSILFGDGDDSIHGDGGNDVIGSWDYGAGNNTIYGDGGHDEITGGSGDDLIYGGTGHDFLSGAQGSDTIYGGDGSDEIWVTDNHDYVSIVGGDEGGDWDLLGFSNYISTQGVTVVFDGAESGSFDFDGTSTYGVFSEIEVIDGTDYDDTFDASANTEWLELYGDSGNDFYTVGSGGTYALMGKGNDTVVGGAGQDEVYGNAGDDVLDGGGGRDNLSGGSGQDTITGGTGDDTLTGGSGDDIYVLGNNSGADVITDFDFGDDDGDGFYNDLFDVSTMQNEMGQPVRAWDVVVTDDGSGNAKLTFPNGETVIMQGIAPSMIDEAREMYAAGIPCFAADTLIATPSGEVAVQDLRPGDDVTTLDAGAQRIIWAGRRHVNADHFAANPHQRPIRMQAGVLGNHSALLVSPQHGMLLDHRHGVDGEVLVRAKHLAEVRGPVHVARGVPDVVYVHLMFEQHQIIFANGAPSESFYPGLDALCLFGPADLGRICKLFPQLTTQPPELAYGRRARPFLGRRQVLENVSLRRPNQARPKVAISV